jgi:hypothetical protein
VDLPRPEVTVTDPREPGALVALDEPPPPRIGRRGAALLAAAVVVAATALFAADVERDRRDAVEQRRLDGVVDLQLGDSAGLWTSSHDARTGTGTVQGVVPLVNHGPRDVRVVDGRLGALRAVDTPTLPAGGAAALLLSVSVRCPGDGRPPPPQPDARLLQVRVETPSGRSDAVLEGDGLPLGSLDDSVQRACLHPPLAERVDLAAAVVGLEDRAAVLRVAVGNRGRRPVRLLSLVPARGLVVLSVDGAATGLPLDLPVPTEGSPAVRTLELRLGVVCGALLGADLLTPFEEVAAIVEDGDRAQVTSVGVLASDPDRQLRQLAGRTCSSG